jgi:hypothetical protein
METDSQDDDKPPMPAQRTPAKRHLALAALVALAVVCAVVVGVRLHATQSHLTPAAVNPVASVEPPIDSEPKPDDSAPPPPTPPAEDGTAWATKLSNIDQLRQALQSKKSEILQVKQDYRHGIRELEDETRRFMKHAGVDSPAQALKNAEIEMLLRNIQRRQIYYESLEKPLDWIDLASEDLLYLSRRAAMDLLVKDVAEGIDMKRLLDEIDHALERYAPTPRRLSVDPGSIAASSLEAIGKRLIEQSRQMGWSAGDRRNQEIEAEVCGGNLSRAAELSKLSLKGARCLAESDAKQLFLNRLIEITPFAAEALSKWPGEWLCMNAITTLEPESAASLFTWRGQWLSLNGLSDLSVETGRHLVGWSGRQLELMGLRRAAGVDYLAQWEAAGRRLFVPDAVRPAIDQAGRQRAGAQPAWR